MVYPARCYFREARLSQGLADHGDNRAGNIIGSEIDTIGKVEVAFLGTIERHVE